MRGYDRRRSAGWAGALSPAALVAALILACPALASNPDNLPNWPALLPPGQSPPDRVALTFDACPGGGARCPAKVIEEMSRHWRPLDRGCDHRAVFALTYLRTTEEFARTVHDDAHFFSDTNWVRHEDAVFAQLYFRAYDRYVDSRPVPAAWRTAFEAARSPNVTGTGDLLLGMNAHINRDLPYTLAHVGLTRKGGGSRKPDHDKVNEFLDRVIDPLQTELARRYDPLFSSVDAEPSPFDEVAALQAIRGMRENAWRNAERLVAARDDPQQLEAVRASIEDEAQAGALTILAANTLPGYGPTRDAYCRRGGRSAREPASRNAHDGPDSRGDSGNHDGPSVGTDVPEPVRGLPGSLPS